MLYKMCLLFSSSFLSRIQQKSRGTDNIGLCFVKYDLACTLLLMFTLFVAEK